MLVDEEDDEVQNDNDLVILEGNDINDELAPSDGVATPMASSACCAGNTFLDWLSMLE
jgi:hypothetical protein